MTLLRCRGLQEADYAALAALDLAFVRAQDSAFDTLPEREQEGRLCTSLPALQFYKRSEHSFVTHWPQAEALLGFAFAQSVWQGDRPMVWVRAIIADPTLAAEQQQEVAAALLRAVVKSAYDTAVYEVHFGQTPLLLLAAQQEEALLQGGYSVIYLGSRAQSARLRHSAQHSEVRAP